MGSIEEAKKVLKIEARAIKNLISTIDRNFEKAVEIAASCKGRIVVMGMGKSGLIGKKIAATLASTGTPAFFLHPAEGILGDVGMMTEGDLVLALSHSGETEEIEKLLPVIRRMNLKLIAITGKPKSKLAKKSDLVINVKVKEEACPYNLVPTASTTAMLAMGDALAISLLKRKKFKKEDFARLHPGGILGKRLLLKVKDIMRKGKDNPVIHQEKTVREALLVMTKTRLGATSVVDGSGKLVGFFTDGDLRRRLQKDEKILNKKIHTVMTKNPKTITHDILAIEAAKMMQEKKFDNIPVIDGKNYPVGIVDERDLLSEGIL
ncbi:MAG: KpsF/GutQ family sugar-phosphate isomerase [bacterium]